MSKQLDMDSSYTMDMFIRFWKEADSKRNRTTLEDWESEDDIFRW